MDENLLKGQMNIWMIYVEITTNVLVCEDED